MTITTKFAPTDTIYYIHPLNGAVVNSMVLAIEIKVDYFGNITILNFTSYGNLEYFINDDVAFATQADLVAAYAPQTVTPPTATLTITGIVPLVEVATP